MEIKKAWEQMKSTIVKNGKKWILISENGDVLFTGNTRKSCFRYAYENGLKVAAHQHGGN